MEQHPVPQQISSYQFRLVGDMTLKQFLQLAAGVLISLIIYATGLPALIKWPLMIFFTAAGAALAFLPFQDRPLEQWVLAFFRSIYSPTLYFWQKPATAPVYFQQEGEALPESQPPIANFVSKLEETEKAFITQVGQFFGQTLPAGRQGPTPTGQVYSATPTKLELKIPQNTPAQIIPQGFKPQVIIEEQKIAEPVVNKPLATQQVSETLRPQATSAPVYAAQFSLEAAPPSIPNQPNTITGQVMDDTGHIIEGAILEVQDEAGRPARALKTNKAGHFLVVTPLVDGNYEIVTEKEGFTFNPINFEAKGEVIAPIAIRAKQRIIS